MLIYLMILISGIYSRKQFFSSMLIKINQTAKPATKKQPKPHAVQHM